MSTPHWHNGLRTRHMAPPDVVLHWNGTSFECADYEQLYQVYCSNYTDDPSNQADYAIEQEHEDYMKLMFGSPNVTVESGRGASLYGVPVVLVTDLDIPVPYKIALCYPSPFWFIRGVQ